MAKPILIRGARQLLTLHGPSGPRRGSDLRNIGVIPDGAVLIVDGVIQAVGPTRRIENLAEARNAEEINAAGRVVMPGFVDSHTHLVGGPRHVLDPETLAASSYDRITVGAGGFPAVFKAIQDLSSRTLEAQAIRVLKECLRQGTTTVESKSGYGLNETGELKILRVHSALKDSLMGLVSTFMGARFIPSDYRDRPDEYMDWLCSYMLPLVHRRGLAEFVDIACEEGAFNIGQARRFLILAKQLGFALKMHAGQAWNIGAVRLAVEMGVTSVDHLLYLNQEDIDLLAGSGTVATLLPGSVFHLGFQRYAAARTLIDSGVAVALASNYNPETSPSQTMQVVIALACQRMEMTAAEAISAATINGAHALRRGNSIGSLEYGKAADIIMLSVPDYREIPYHFGVNLVEMTMKGGRVVYRAPDIEWIAS